MPAAASSRIRNIPPLLIAIAAFACGGDGPAEPPAAVECGGTEVRVLELQPLEGVTVRGSELECIALAGAGASYIVAPQLVGASLPYGGYGYRLGDLSVDPLAAVPQVVSPNILGSADPLATGDAQQMLDGWLRRTEATLTPRRHGARPTIRAQLAVAPPPLDSRREFSVLAGLVEPAPFTRVGAELRFAGENVLLYTDTLAAAAFTAGDLARLGVLFDESLVAPVRDAFGSESDIDGNGRIIVLLTPVVNGLVSASQCSISGYVRGFFFAHDLAAADQTSNEGEILYALVPDPDGRWSCPIGTSEVMQNIAPTLIHELQHMISYGQHAVARGGPMEVPWLNEGLSHLAEEIGSLYYEAKYPPPAGRTTPTQLFPDSAGAFITPNLRAAHRYLFLSNQYSALSCAPGSFCSLPERSAAWLFLRWLGDQKGASVYRHLVQTSSTGAANIEAAAGESLASLFGDFTTALWADSIVGVPRAGVSPRHRFLSRNFRTLYRALYDAFGPIGGVGRPFPIEPTLLAPGTSLSGTMRPGTFVMYRLDVPGNVPASLLGMSQVDGTPFGTAAGAQLSILRLPD